MAINRSIVELPLSGGIDTRAHPGNAPVGSWTVANDVTYERPGAIAKRDGWASKLTGGASPAWNDMAGTTITVGDSLATDGDELVMLGGAVAGVGHAYKFSGAAGKWVDLGRHVPCSLDVSRASESERSFVTHSAAEYSTYRAVAIDLAGSVLVRIFSGEDLVLEETLTGAGGNFLHYPIVTQIPTGSAVGSGFSVIVADTTARSLYVYYYTIVAGVVSRPAAGDYFKDSGSTALTSGNCNAITSILFDGHCSGSSLFVAFQLYPTANGVRVLKSDGVTTTYSDIAATPVNFMSIDVCGSYLAVCFPVDTGGAGTEYDLNGYVRLASDLSAVRTDAIGTYATYGYTQGTHSYHRVGAALVGSNIVYAHSVYTDATKLSVTRYVGLVATTGAASWSHELHHAEVASKPLSSGPAVRQWVRQTLPDADGNELQPCYYLVEVTTAPDCIVLARTATNIADFYTSTTDSGSHRIQTSGSVYLACWADDFVTFVRRVVSDTTPGPISHAQLGDYIVFGGGYLGVYDGDAVCECNFLQYPTRIISSSTDSGDVNVGTHYYRAVYEWLDSRGRIHRSTPSEVYTEVVASTTKRITFLVPSLGLTMRGTRPVVRIYGTTVNGTVYYDTGSYAANVLNASTVSVQVNIADSALTDNGVLYTEGGTLTPNGVSACDGLVSHGSRLWCVLVEDRTQLAYTAALVAGVGPEPSDYLVQSSMLGEVTGLASLADKLVIFGRRNIRYLYGDGPNATGSGSFSAETLMSRGQGATSWAGIVQYPGGLLYCTERGWYGMGADMASQYIGAPIWDYDGEPMRVVVDHASHQIVMLLTGESYLVCYDWIANAWYTMSRPASPLDLSVCTGGVALLYATTLIQLDGTATADNTGNISMTLTTPWLHLAGVPKYQTLDEIQIAGTLSATSSKVRVTVYHDYASAATHDKTYTVTEAALGTSTGQFRLCIKPSTTHCESVKISIYDVTNTGAFAVYAIQLIVAADGPARYLGLSGTTP